MKAGHIGAALVCVWYIFWAIVIAWEWRSRHRVLREYRRGRRWSSEEFIAAAGPTRHVNPVALEIAREAVSNVTGVIADRLGPHAGLAGLIPVGFDLDTTLDDVQLLLDKRRLPRIAGAEKLAIRIEGWVTALDVAEAVTRHVEAKHAWQSVEEVARDSR